MSRLEAYRQALRVADPAATRESLCRTVDVQGPDLVSLIVDHGLGPFWHERTARDEFHDTRLAAEALFLAQDEALREVGGALTAAGIDHAVIKGAANRLLLYENPALRACHDLDVLVSPGDRLRAATALTRIGFLPAPDPRSISREIVLRRGSADVDLHWSLLREGRLRVDLTQNLLARRRQSGDMWVLADDDALFLLLVHPAFAKHLDAWEMGLHRLLDLLEWLRQRATDWPAVRTQLEQTGVCTAAWATLHWADLLAGPQAPKRLGFMLADLKPAALRSVWLDYWLREDLPARTAGQRWFRLLAFSAFLHDMPLDALRAYAGQRRARRRRKADLEAFSTLLGQ